MKTYNDLLLELESIPYSKDYIDIYKEQSELELMESYIENQLYLKEYFDVDYNEILMESLNEQSKGLLEKIYEKIFNFFMKILRLIRDGLNALISWLDTNFNPNEYERALANAKRMGQDMKNAVKEVGKGVAKDFKNGLKTESANNFNINDINLNDYKIDEKTLKNLYQEEKNNPNSKIKKFFDDIEKYYKEAKNTVNHLSFIHNKKLRKCIKDGLVKININNSKHINFLNYFKYNLPSNPNFSDIYNNIYLEFLELCYDYIKNDYTINFEIKKSYNFVCMNVNDFISFIDYLTEHFKDYKENINYWLRQVKIKGEIKHNGVQDKNIDMSVKGVKKFDVSARKMIAFIIYQNMMSYFDKKNNSLKGKITRSIDWVLHSENDKIIINVDKKIYKKLHKKVSSFVNVSEKSADDIRKYMDNIHFKLVDGKIRIVGVGEYEYINDKHFEKLYYSYEDLQKIPSKQIMDAIRTYYDISNNLLSIIDTDGRVNTIIKNFCKVVVKYI